MDIRWIDTSVNCPTIWPSPTDNININSSGCWTMSDIIQPSSYVALSELYTTEPTSNAACYYQYDNSVTTRVPSNTIQQPSEILVTTDNTIASTPSECSDIAIMSPTDSDPFDLDLSSFEFTQQYSQPTIGSTSFAQTKTKLIKDSLKVTIQSKRLAQGLNAIELTTDADDSNSTNIESNETLTCEDEERRRKRRERNKLAATRCRSKKKQYVCRLFMESETLEAHNLSIQKEMIHLESEKLRLINILNRHSQSYCKLAKY